MIDSRNINVIRSNVRDMKAETGANTSAVLELETLVGATPLPTGQTTITGAIKYLDEKPSGGEVEFDDLWTGEATSGSIALDVETVDKLRNYRLLYIETQNTAGDYISSSTFDVATIADETGTFPSFAHYAYQYYATFQLTTTEGVKLAISTNGVKVIKVKGIKF